MSAIKFKPGDTLDWAGQIALDGVSDYSGYTLKSQVRKKDKAAGEQPTPDKTADGLLAEAEMSWINAATSPATFRMKVAKEVTADWPVNDVAFVDVSLINSLGEVVTTETSQFDLLQRSTAVA